MTFTFIICTFDRIEVLIKSVIQLVEILEKKTEVEILIIDNHSIQNLELIRKELLNYTKFKFILESNRGLSYARNRGAKEAKGEWLVYLDDDAKVHPNYFERLLYVINNYDFDCFGGMYYAWYPYGKPKWINWDFGTKTQFQDHIGRIYESWLSGGNFAIKKTVLEKVGGFPVGVGMEGDKIKYGEETIVQKKILEQGYKLGFDPELKIDHAVLPHKLKLSWHLKSAYAYGRDRKYSVNENFIFVFYLFFKSFIGGFLKLPLCLIKLIYKKNYYWQNWVLDVIYPIIFRMGQLKSVLS